MTEHELPDDDRGGPFDPEQAALDRAVAESKRLDVAARVQEAEAAAKHHAHDPLDALDNPGYVIRCMVLDAIKLFNELTGHAPTHVGITPAMEALLSVKDPDIKKMIAERGKLRNWPKVFDCVPHFGVSDFFLA